jgi:hypothetical protein
VKVENLSNMNYINDAINPMNIVDKTIEQRWVLHPAPELGLVWNIWRTKAVMQRR